MKIIGISVKTTNENRQSTSDIERLWEYFFSKNIISHIPNKKNENIFSIYTDYESDFRGKYMTILGVEVTSLEEIPEGMIGREFPEQTFKKIIAKGEIPKAVGIAWQQIWDMDLELNRSYLYDYDLYTQKSQQGTASEVEIFVGVKNN